MSHIRSFSNERVTTSPREIFEKLYNRGLEKMTHDKHMATTKDIQKIDPRYTFRPLLNINSTKIVNKKDADRSTRNIAEHLYS
jgi:hypothetical protein